MDLEPDIERLSQGIRLLKVQYDQYFAGALAKQPLELRGELEEIIRRYANAPLSKLHQRFHFNSLVSSFNAYSELWAKQLRAREEGRQLPGTPAAARAEDPESPPRTDPSWLAQRVLRGADPDVAAIRELYESYLEARRDHVAPRDAISFPHFSRQVQRTAEAVRNRTECDAVRLRLAFDGQRLSLRAAPVRYRKDP
jgi:hypothetical protein